MNIASAIEAGHLVENAYAGTEPDGWTVVSDIWADETASHIFAGLDDFARIGFVATRGNETVVSFRGTEGFLEWIQDVKFLPRAWKAGRVEDGFLDLYQSLRIGHDEREYSAAEYMLARERLTGAHGPLTITGHSLGAALACLLALDLSLEEDPSAVYAFGCPKVGDAAFASRYLLGVEGYRISNPFDVVPDLPLGPYVPCGELVSAVHESLSLIENHSMSSYLAGLQRLAA